MKLNLVIVALILTIFSFKKVFAQDTLYWSSGYKLKPKDFRGKPDTTASYPSISICGIKYNGHAKKNAVQTEAFGIFIRPKSWAVISEDDSLWLIHEQVNFDIAELFARKLRKTFSEYKFSYATVQQDLDSLYDINHEEMNTMHASYEKETNHGIDESAQSIWNHKIKSELENFEKYSSN
jgi:secreted PhoX family phosphatase